MALTFPETKDILELVEHLIGERIDDIGETSFGPATLTLLSR